MKTILFMVTLAVTLFPTFASEPLVRLYETVSTSSPNHAEAYNNIMADAISKGTANVPRGLHNPRAVHMPDMLQIGGMVFTRELGYDRLWDGTNFANFPFYIETGKAMAATFDHESTVPFIASVSFSVLFQDQGNTFGTNGIISDRFSQFYYGEQWDVHGNVVKTFSNGELVATQLVNRVVVFTGAYGFVATRANLQQNIDYLKSRAMSNTFTFFVQNAPVATRTLTSNPRLRVEGRTIIILDGQRLPNTHTVKRSVDGINWTTFVAQTNSGWCIGIPTTGMALYKAHEIVSSTNATKSHGTSWKPTLGN